MTIVTQNIFTSAKTALSDAGAVHWTSAELMDYLNAGVRALIIARPDASTKITEFVPVYGPRQSLPDEAVAFIDILGNTNGTRRSIDRVDMNVMSAVSRDWQSAPHKPTALNFMFDFRDPRTFYLYPPSDGNGKIDLLHSVFPASITSWAGALPLNPQWETPLMNYVVGRALLKDAEYGGNNTTASTYLTAFTTDIGQQLQSSTSVTNKS